MVLIMVVADIFFYARIRDGAKDKKRGIHSIKIGIFGARTLERLGIRQKLPVNYDIVTRDLLNIWDILILTCELFKIEHVNMTLKFKIM